MSRPPTNDFSDWFKDQDWYLRKNDTRKATHYFLDGGKGCVTDEAAFHTQLASALWHGEWVYAVEVRTEVFRMYADLDFLTQPSSDVGGGTPEVPDTLEIIRVVQKSMQDQGIRDDCLVLSAADKLMCKGGRDFRKTGLHVVFPETYVTKEQAKVLRVHIVRALESSFGPRPDYNPWSDVFDECVYKGNGLRMTGCRKAERCRDCQEQVAKVRQEGGDTRTVPCETCTEAHTGTPRRYLDKGRPYRITRVVKADGQESTEELCSLASDVLSLIRLTHIRSTRTKPSVNLDFDMPQELGSVISAVASRTHPKRSSKQAFSSDNMDAKTAFDGLEELRKFFDTRFPQQSKLVVTCLHFGSHITVRTESRWCENVGRNHMGNHVYLHVTRRGVQQRCHCNCETLDGRKFGLCRNYRSPTVPLPKSLQKRLFHKLDDNVLTFDESDTEDDALESLGGGSSAAGEEDTSSLFAPRGRTETFVRFMRTVKRNSVPASSSATGTALPAAAPKMRKLFSNQRGR